MSEPPIDPDVDLRQAPSRDELVTRRWSVLAAISAGGVIGALSRYGLQYAFPHAPASFGWATFAINVSGCLFIGVIWVAFDANKQGWHDKIASTYVVKA